MDERFRQLLDLCREAYGIMEHADVGPDPAYNSELHIFPDS